MAGFEPQRVVRSRRVDVETAELPVGSGAGGWEEYVEYIFPDTAAEQPNRKLLAFANKWAMGHDQSDDDGSDVDGSTVLGNGDYDEDRAETANFVAAGPINLKETHSSESDRDE